MGEAFRDGQRIGEAFGATKREVFDKLSERHPDADEIRIRTLKNDIVEAASAEMPRYRCHKEVHALKIADVRDDHGTCVLVPAEAGFAAFPVSFDFVRKHGPFAGGYYVVYKDGYKSFSPADAFEDGYTRV